MATTTSLTAETPTKTPKMSTQQQEVSYKDTLAYLQDDFLPAIKDNAASLLLLTNHHDTLHTPRPAVSHTPLHTKKVGTVEFLRTNRQEEQDTSWRSLQQDTEELLNQLSSTLTRHMDRLYLKKDAVNRREHPIHPKMGMSLLQALYQCMESIINLTCTKTMKLISLQSVLTLSNKLIEDAMDEDALIRSANVRLELALIIAKVFRHLEKVPFQKSTTASEMRLYIDCSGACLQNFSRFLLILSSLPAYQDYDTGRLEQQGQQLQTGLYNVLEDYKIVESILFQNRSLDRVQDVTHVEDGRILDFFSLLATSGDANLLSFLVSDEIAPLLNEILRKCNHQSNDSQRNIRGYRPSSQATQKGAGILKHVRTGWEEDPKHDNVCRVYEFLAVLMRAATDTYSRLPGDDKVKKRYFDKALYCLDRNQRSVRECLQHVSRATWMDAQPHRGTTTQGCFTMQVLREATAILALLTQLCEGGSDLFQQKYPQLYRDLVEDARLVVLSTCCFLGASGISRELFRAMSDLEKDNGGSLTTVTAGSLGFSPIIDVFLSSGRNNTRHEAIQFSHFVSGCSAAVSTTERNNQMEFPAEWASTSSPGSTGLLGQPAPLTESSLEQNSRRAMTSKFEFALEMEAAKCLFHGTSVMWVSHPSSTSFVQFTPEERNKLRRDISWIKAHNIIAYCTDGIGSTALGEVEYVDTINLSCVVRPVDNKENQVVVPLGNLLGVEDRTKRQSTLACSPAPETSDRLYRSTNQLSVGHLMFALRWCHEYSFEQEQQGVASSKQWIRMNSQVLSLVLAKELALQRENPSAERLSSSTTQMMNAQLLDIFGNQQEFSSFLQGYNTAAAMRKSGRLDGLISPPMWDVVRAQLKQEIQHAMDTIKAVQAQETQKHSHSAQYYNRGPSTYYHS